MGEFVYKKDDTFAPLFDIKKEAESLLVFEAAAPQLIAEAAFGDSQDRAQAMGIALSWIESGEYTADFLDGLIMGIIDINEDDDVGEEEEEAYNMLYAAVGEAFLALGGNSDNVASLINDGDDEAAAKLGSYLTDKLGASDMSDDDIVAKYALSPDMVMESTVKRMRDGAVTWVKKKPKKKHQISSGLRAALKKARLKAQTGAAKRKRMKSVKKGRKLGLY